MYTSTHVCLFVRYLFNVVYKDIERMREEERERERQRGIKGSL